MNYGAQCSPQGAGHHQNMPCPTLGVTLHLWSSRNGCFTPFYAGRCFVSIDHHDIERIRWRSKTSTDFTRDQWITSYWITIKFTLVDLRDFKLHFIKQSQSVWELMSMGHLLHVKPEVLETLEQVTQSCTLPAAPELTFPELKDGKCRLKWTGQLPLWWGCQQAVGQWS